MPLHTCTVWGILLSLLFPAGGVHTSSECTAHLRVGQCVASWCASAPVLLQRSPFPTLGSLTWPDLRPSLASSSCLRVSSLFSYNTLSITSAEVRGPNPGAKRRHSRLPISSWSFLLRDWVVPLLYVNAMSRRWSQQANLKRLPLSFSHTSVEGNPASLWGKYSLKSLNCPPISGGSKGPQPLIDLVRWNSFTHTNNKLVSSTIPWSEHCEAGMLGWRESLIQAL